MGTLTVLMILGLGMGENPPAAFASPFLGAPVLQAAGYSKEDLKKLIEAKVSEETILAFIRKNTPGPTLSIQDLLDLRAAGASDAVLVASLQPSSAAVPSPPAPRSADDAVVPNGPYSSVPYYSSYSDTYPYYYSSYPYGYVDPYYYSFGYGIRFPFRNNRFHSFNNFNFNNNHIDHFNHGPRGAIVSPHGGFHGGGSSSGGHSGGGHR